MKPISPLQRYVEQTFDAIDKAMQIAVDLEVPDVLLAQLAHAHVGAVRSEMAMHAIDVPNHEVPPHALERYLDQHPGAKPKPLELPKLVKQPKPQAQHRTKGHNAQRPGISKLRKSPTDFACPTCFAEKGTACFKMTGPGHKSQITTERRTDGWMHKARTQLSTRHNVKMREQYDREHFQAGE